METIAQNPKERQYYIDWLRIFLILSVFLFHIGMIFNSWGWHVKNDVTCVSKSILWYIMSFLSTWRMPLLIMVSGAGTYFALGKRTSGQYLGERFKRLFPSCRQCLLRTWQVLSRICTYILFSPLLPLC